MRDVKDHIVIGITMGDYNGIGPEIVLKSLGQFSNENAAVILIGAQQVFDQVNEIINSAVVYERINHIDEHKIQPKNIYLLDVLKNEDIRVEFGALSKHAGLCAGKCIGKGVQLAIDGKIDCMVTSPISKEALMMAGYHFPGQTEMLAKLTRSEKFLMMLLVDDFRVSLVTTHCAISEVSDKLTSDKILFKIKILEESLCKDFGIAEPSIAVTALNPHASDGGAFGFEEEKYIVPAIRDAKLAGIDARGPFPADTLFSRLEMEKYDGYLAMYHDQGLIPLKMQSAGRGVNFTAGLPIIRTSPDHGTAFDIAGKFIAKSDSMLEAIKLGQYLAQKRKNC